MAKDFLNDPDIIYEDYSMYNCLDLKGNRVLRTPRSDPYSYDTICIMKTKHFSPKDECFYSDRFIRWFDEDLIAKYRKQLDIDGGDYFWVSNSLEDLSKFISLLYGKHCEITAICQGCNWATGYPIWTIYYTSEEAKDCE